MRNLLIVIVGVLQATSSRAATPLIDILSPPSASPGTGPLLLTIHGANLGAGVMVQVDSQSFTPTLLSAGRLTITLPASALATAHTAIVTVTSPGTPRSSISNVALFPVGHPSPAITATQTLFPFNEPRGLATADFNLDGNADVAVTSWCTLLDSVCSPGKVNVLPGTGNGSFGAPMATNVCPFIGALTAADFNNDGKPDIAALCEDGVQILTGDGAGHFQVSPVFPFLAPPHIVQILSAVLALDVNGDGNLDLLVGGSPGVGVLLGDGAGGLAPVSVVCAACVEANDMTAGDFNNDGHPDVAAVTYYDQNVTLLLGDGTGGFTIRKVPTGFDSYAVAAGDFNGDGNTDIAVGTGSNSAASSTILLGDGTGAFTTGPRLSTGTVRKLVAADLNGDGRTDLALTTDRSALVYALADSTGDLTLFSSTSLSAYGGTLNLADFNNDGKLDIATIGPNDSRLAILVQTPAPPSRTEYTITDICLPLSCYAWLLSDNGVAAGHNFAVYPGTGVLDFVQRTGQTFEPSAINKAGVIVGSAGFAQGQNPNTGYAAVWSPGRAELLNLDPVFGWTRGIATSINNVGLIVGYSPDGPPVTGLVPG
ncbi:MAG: alkaline phosphatase, partial [Planctomycetaceae bacterium]|nr:alkaline phosphatase [Planctomycetaceae bacterium]